eukprot:4925662-Pleurochrysis_carterae.AAC.6
MRVLYLARIPCATSLYCSQIKVHTNTSAGSTLRRRTLSSGAASHPTVWPDSLAFVPHALRECNKRYQTNPRGSRTPKSASPASVITARRNYA